MLGNRSILSRISVLRSLGRDERGAEAISFAFIAPILVVVSLAIVDFGRALQTDSTIRHAAREAARYASMHGVESEFPAPDLEIATIAVSAAAGIKLTTDDVTISWTPNGASGSTVSVEIDYVYESLLGGLVLSSEIPLSASARRVVF